MARTGRPKADNPKSIHFNVRLSESENAELEAYCQKYGTTKSRGRAKRNPHCAGQR